MHLGPKGPFQKLCCLCSLIPFKVDCGCRWQQKLSFPVKVGRSGNQMKLGKGYKCFKFLHGKKCGNCRQVKCVRGYHAGLIFQE